MGDPRFHVIFDLDGTLVDSREGILWALRFAWEKVCPEEPFPEAGIRIGPPIRLLFQRAVPAIEEERLAALALAYRGAYDTLGWKNLSVYPGVPEVLNRLREGGVCCHIATNKPALPTRLILEHSGLHSCFHAILGPDSATPPFDGKAAMIEHIQRKEYAQPEHCVFVGDSQDDAEAAHRAGIRFIWAGYGYGQLAENTDHQLLSGITELPGLLGYQVNQELK